MSETRKIAAILVSDVVGYSRLAGADEDRAPVTGDNLIAFVDQNGRVETECFDASRDRLHRDPAMLAWIARISAEGADRNERQFSDAFGGVWTFVRQVESRRDRRCLDRAGSARRRRPFSYAGAALAHKESDLFVCPD
jgi:hypothetical protein